jgi:hypothetical protein
MPSGVPNRTARMVSNRLPTIAFRSPPALPGGGVISVKTSSDSPPTPFTTRTNKISTSHVRPKPAAAMASVVAKRFRQRLRR